MLESEGLRHQTDKPLYAPVEISVQARLCNGTRLHRVGDLITYRSGIWMVKGFYLGPTATGGFELYYSLAEATPSSHQLSVP